MSASAAAPTPIKHGDEGVVREAGAAVEAVKAILADAAEWGMLGLDLEWNKAGHITWLGIGTKKRAHSFWFPTLPQEAVDLVKAAFADENLPKLIQNLQADKGVWEREMNSPIAGTIDDTLLMHHAAFPGIAHDLQNIASQFLVIPPWKTWQRQEVKRLLAEQKAAEKAAKKEAKRIAHEQRNAARAAEKQAKKDARVKERAEKAAQKEADKVAKAAAKKGKRTDMSAIDPRQQELPNVGAPSSSTPEAAAVASAPVEKSAAQIEHDARNAALHAEAEAAKAQRKAEHDVRNAASKAEAEAKRKADKERKAAAEKQKKLQIVLVGEDGVETAATTPTPEVTASATPPVAPPVTFPAPKKLINWSLPKK